MVPSSVRACFADRRTAPLSTAAARRAGRPSTIAAVRSESTASAIRAKDRVVVASAVRGCAPARWGGGGGPPPAPGGGGRAPAPGGRGGAALDGVIASSMAADALAALRGDGLPLVMLDSDPDRTGAAATVNVDIAAGMRQLTEHLLTLGHRHLVHLAAAVDSWAFRVRAGALAAALGGVPGASVRTEPAPLSVAGGLSAAERALTRPGPRPTALVCDDDVLAAGACKAVRRLGLRVPHDVSVTGFDDISLATAVDPELTTVRLPAEAVGAAGMRALLTVVDGGVAEVTTLPVELVTRASTAPPPPTRA
ncbi:substrate-binding domain-containing protein [Streptomyces sp. HSW2009]|uniref:LacI family DNA-binding transcriptional regulator n=1 Tax=Streptomyces sp. HSW2009 TaxID=3142890 RepID=UPI0032ED3B3F